MPNPDHLSDRCHHFTAKMLKETNTACGLSDLRTAFPYLLLTDSGGQPMRQTTAYYSGTSGRDALVWLGGHRVKLSHTPI